MYLNTPSLLDMRQSSPLIPANAFFNGVFQFMAKCYMKPYIASGLFQAFCLSKDIRIRLIDSKFLRSFGRHKSRFHISWLIQVKENTCKNVYLLEIYF